MIGSNHKPIKNLFKCLVFCLIWDSGAPGWIQPGVWYLTSSTDAPNIYWLFPASSISTFNSQNTHSSLILIALLKLFNSFLEKKKIFKQQIPEEWERWSLAFFWGQELRLVSRGCSIHISYFLDLRIFLFDTDSNTVLSQSLSSLPFHCWKGFLALSLSEGTTLSSKMENGDKYHWHPSNQYP
jgi:hypothetical protein